MAIDVADALKEVEKNQRRLRASQIELRDKILERVAEILVRLGAVRLVLWIGVDNAYFGDMMDDRGCEDEAPEDIFNILKHLRHIGDEDHIYTVWTKERGWQ